MNIALSWIKKLKDNLEITAFLVSKGGSERDAHGKIIESLVIVSQMEVEFKKIFSNYSLESGDELALPSESSSISPKSFKAKDDEVVQEINKVTRKLPKWFKNPSQINATILLNFLKLYELGEEKISFQTLKSKCSSVNDFDGNYNQMKNFGEKNHGKVFDERDGYITLWEPVKEFILKMRNENMVQQ